MTSAPEYIDPRRDLAPVNGTPLPLAMRRAAEARDRADRRWLTAAVVAFVVACFIAGVLFFTPAVGG